MTVNSLLFPLFLLGACFLYYGVCPLKYRWVVLLAASMFFYVLACGAFPVYFLTTSVTVWLAGLLMDREENAAADRTAAGTPGPETKKICKKKKKRIMTAAIALNLGILIALKYSRMAAIAGNLFSGITGIKMAVPKLTAPLGISYYTLIAIGYLVDIYKGKITAQKNYAKLLLFLSYFPQITQGPLNRYRAMAPQLYEGHRLDYHNISYGWQRILWGFFKKLVVADRMQDTVTYIFENYSGLSGVTCFLGCVYMTVWMYADFSAYMDIAAGASELFGIQIAENFKRPFFSESLAEYWRRWHITLSAWFRDYMFYPLAVSGRAICFGKKGRKRFGARVGKLFPSLYAMVFVWFCTGLWHNASARYILWGVANGVVMMGAMVLEPWFTKAKKALHIRTESRGWHIFCMVRTFLLVSLLKIFPGPAYSAACIGFTKAMLTHLWLPAGVAGWFPELTMRYLPILAFALALMFLVDVVQEKHPVRDVIAAKPLAVRWLIYFSVIALTVFFGKFQTVSMGGFAYARF